MSLNTSYFSRREIQKRITEIEKAQSNTEITITTDAGDSQCFIALNLGTYASLEEWINALVSNAETGYADFLRMKVSIRLSPDASMPAPILTLYKLIDSSAPSTSHGAVATNIYNTYTNSKKLEFIGYFDLKQIKAQEEFYGDGAVGDVTTAYYFYDGEFRFPMKELFKFTGAIGMSDEHVSDPNDRTYFIVEVNCQNSGDLGVILGFSQNDLNYRKEKMTVR